MGCRGPWEGDRVGRRRRSGCRENPTAYGHHGTSTHDPNRARTRRTLCLAAPKPLVTRGLLPSSFPTGGGGGGNWEKFCFHKPMLKRTFVLNTLCADFFFSSGRLPQVDQGGASRPATGSEVGGNRTWIESQFLEHFAKQRTFDICLLICIMNLLI